MKFLITFLTLLPLVAQGKSLKEFSSVMTKELHQEIRKDDEKFKRPTSRAPASARQIHERVIEEPKKIDKNVRQIGPNSW